MALIDGIVASYSMDNDWLDNTASNNDGTATGAIFDNTNQKLGTHAGSFDGIDDYVTLSNEANFDLTNDFTIACWVRLTDVTDVQQYLFSKWFDGSQRAYNVTIENKNVRFTTSTTGTDTDSTITTTNPIAVNDTWYQITVIFKSNNIHQIWVDNNLEKQATITGSNVNTNSMIPIIGASHTFGANLGGLVDEFVIWNKVLDSTEMSDFYNGGTGLAYPYTVAVDTITVGVATAVDGGNHDIDVSMPYTDDDNNDSTYTIDYKLSADSTYTNHVTGASNTPSPYTDTIIGLQGAETYDVRCTYVDPDGVTGTNPQTITDIPIEALPSKVIPKVVKNGFEYKVVKSSSVQKIIKRIAIDKVVK